MDRNCGASSTREIYPTAMAQKVPMMNISPPIVGVPSLYLCQVGPISLMVCPYLIFLSHGIIQYPRIVVTVMPTNTAAKIDVRSMISLLCKNLQLSVPAPSRGKP